MLSPQEGSKSDAHDKLGSDNITPLPTTNVLSGLKKLTYSELTIGCVVGEGSFGVVYSGMWRGVPVAIKQLKEKTPLSSTPNQSDANRHADLLHEAETMARVCNHAFVIQLIGIAFAPSPCVVTVFYENGSVEDLLIHNKSSCRCDLDSSVLLRFAFEAALAVHHLHLEGVVHRDLAARNLLIDENFHIRVSDFGFSRVKEEGASKGYTASTLGPVRWTAPEAMRKKVFSERSDVFSLGVVLFELFYQEVPWKDCDTIDVVIRVCSGELMPLPPLPSHVYMPETVGGCLGVRELMELCWSFDPMDRPHITDVITTLKVHMDTLSATGEQLVGGSDLSVSDGGLEGGEEDIMYEDMATTSTYDLMPAVRHSPPPFLPPPPPPRQRRVHPAAQAIRQEHEAIPHLLKPPPPDWRKTVGAADLFDSELRRQLLLRRDKGRDEEGAMAVFVELEKQRAAATSKRRAEEWGGLLSSVRLRRAAAGDGPDHRAKGGEAVLAEEQTRAVSELRSIYERKERGESNWIRG
jgi:serine/threonine protein kinase